MSNAPYYVARTRGSSWVVLLLVVLVLALAGYFGWHRYVGRAGAAPAELPRAAAPTAPPTVPTPVVAAPVVADATAGASTAAAPVVGKTGSMRFPDGTTRPALNGVTETLDIPWPSGRPWSPVVEQVHHNGVDWLRHADGSFSTTIVRTEEVSGRTVQMPLCFTPTPATGTPSLRQPQ